MSVCPSCHVAYTKRDIYPLNVGQYLTKRDERMYPPSVIGTRGINGGPPRPAITNGDSPVSSDSEEPYGLTVPALLQRIRDLEAAVSHRDGQIQEWRRQFDKNSQSLLMHLRELRELKQEVMDWWRRFKEKDLEVQALRRSLSTKPPAVIQSPPFTPAHKRGLDGSRLVTRARIEVPAGMRRVGRLGS